MLDWAGFALALTAFFLSHSLPVRPPLRPALVAALGQRGFTIAYSLMSLAVLAWLIMAARNAPFVPLWHSQPWQGHLSIALMLLTCIVIALAIGRPNPLSFGGAQNSRFDPKHPGITRLTRHPLLLALVLWSLAHVLPNGDLAHVLMFGIFGVFATFGGRLVDRRKRREMGADWHRLIQEIKHQPLGSIATSAPRNDALRILVGLLMFAALIWLHPIVIGIDPLWAVQG